jgi:hypothetical protein
LSNGAIAPLLSNAQPIVIVPAVDDVERAAAVAATATTATASAAAMSPMRELNLLIFTPLLVGVGGLAKLCNRACSTREPSPPDRQGAAALVDPLTTFDI